MIETIALSHYEYTSEWTQSHSSIEAHTPWEYHHNIETSVVLTNKYDLSAIALSRLLLLDGPYTMSLQWNET